MNADRQIEPARGVVQREKVTVTEQPLTFRTAEKNSDGAVFLCSLGFVENLIRAEERYHCDPPQPILRLLPEIAHPAVVTPAELELDLRLLGQRDDEDGWKDDLDIDAELIHMLEARVNVAQFARGHRRIFSDIAGFEPQRAV